MTASLAQNKLDHAPKLFADQPINAKLYRRGILHANVSSSAPGYANSTALTTGSNQEFDTRNDTHNLAGGTDNNAALTLLTNTNYN